MVTLTRGIDMYRIGPFPRPQFFEGPRPQLLAFRGPSSRVRGAISPSNRPRGQQGAARSRRFGAARHDSPQSIRTTRALPPPPVSAGHRAARHREVEPNNRTSRHATTRPRATTRSVPVPGRRTTATAATSATHASRSHVEPSGATIEDHRPEVPPRSLPNSSRPRQDVHRTTRRAEPPRRHDRRESSSSHASGEPNRGPGSRRQSTLKALRQRTHGEHAQRQRIQRPDLNEGNQHNESAARHPRDEPLQERTSTRTFVHSADDGNRGVRPAGHTPRSLHDRQHSGGFRSGRSGRAAGPELARTSRHSRIAAGKSRSARAASASVVRDSGDRCSAQARSPQARASARSPRSRAARACRRWRAAARSIASTWPRSVRQRWQEGPLACRAPQVGQRSTSPISR